jgi:alcohol dehydrogenase (cytochrome c)
MNLRTFASVLLAAAALRAQDGLNPAKLMQQPTDTWPMYHGDYSGRRFSTLTNIN